jgi:sugar lactone lactonase YvrE
MQLRGIDAQSVELHIAGYQFPDLAAVEYDSNWLTIEGQVRHPRGRWSFRDPCLLTSEVSRLATWLDALAQGKPESDEIGFIEPNLSFRVVRSAAFAVLRVYFELEARPYLSAANEVLRFGPVPIHPSLNATAPVDWSRTMQNGWLSRLSATGPVWVAAAIVAVFGAQATYGQPMSRTDLKSDSYQRVDHFLRLPAGRSMGSTSAVTVDAHGHIWVADRCGANSCQGSLLDPIMEFDARGNFLRAFGRGRFVFPHGIFIDRADHIWVTDAKSADSKTAAAKGNAVFEFDPNGKLLRTIGGAGNGSPSAPMFHLPSAVLVAPDGNIFVADGHDPGERFARILKLDSSGRVIKQWGENGSGPGQFDMPHALALDSRGRLFVADRGNNRIQVFDQDGRLLAIWTQFGRPSGICIDRHGVLYATDSESRNAAGYGHHPGWPRGIRIGRATDGEMLQLISDPAPDQEHEDTTGGEGIAVDANGNIYSAQVKEQAVVKYVKR